MIHLSEELEFQFIVRCAGADCPGDELIPYALTHIRGIGYRLAQLICEKAELDPTRRMGTITDDEVSLIEDIITNPSGFSIPTFLLNRCKDLTTGENTHQSGTDLFLANKSDVDLMKKVRSYKGIRHSLGLKVRGQRTKTTGRGGQTVGVTRKKRA
ncbi:MAG: 30S ribosomal protein S13 [Promethearchaeota archaeon]